MSEEIRVTEKDIFNIVFSPESVESEKKKIIRDTDDFHTLIEFYEGIKKEMYAKLTENQKNIIASKISAYKKEKVIKLFPVMDEIEANPTNITVIAAASTDNEQRIKAQSFIDEGKSIVIRLIWVGSNAKLYVFPVSNTGIRGLSLRLHPTNQEFTISNIKEPLELESLPEIESISVAIE